jgi:ferredoxin, 2Fe-2S
MAKVHVTDRKGEQHELEGVTGWSVMEIIREAGLPIEAACGGCCACATCHVYVDEEWKDVVGPPSPMEEDMLDFASDVRPTSRLSCQIRVRPELDGLVVQTPKRQG